MPSPSPPSIGISIVVPCYNRANHLPKLVQAICEQTNPNWQLILVNDGSTDDTVSYFNSLSSNPKIHTVNQANFGASIARNTGAKYANYPYLGFVDSDDFVTNTWVADFITFLQQPTRNQFHLVFCNAISQSEDGTVLGKAEPQFENFFGKPVLFYGGSFIILKQLFDSVGGFWEKSKDGIFIALAFKLLQNGLFDVARIGYIPHYNSTIIRHNGNISSNLSVTFQNKKLFFDEFENILLKDAYAYLANANLVARMASQNGQWKATFKYWLKALRRQPSYAKSYYRIVKYTTNLLFKTKYA